MFNGNFRILKWRYCTVPCKAIFCGDIPLHRPYIGLIYGRYLQFRFLKWPLKCGELWSCCSCCNKIEIIKKWETIFRQAKIAWFTYHQWCQHVFHPADIPCGISTLAPSPILDDFNNDLVFQEDLASNQTWLAGQFPMSFPLKPPLIYGNCRWPRTWLRNKGDGVLTVKEFCASAIKSG